MFTHKLKEFLELLEIIFNVFLCFIYILVLSYSYFIYSILKNKIFTVKQGSMFHVLGDYLEHTRSFHVV